MIIELEVVLSPQQAISEGISIAHEVMEKIGINKDDLVGKSYIDLQLEQQDVAGL